MGRSVPIVYHVALLGRSAKTGLTPVVSLIERIMVGPRYIGRALAALVLWFALAGGASGQTGETVATVQALEGAVTILRDGGRIPITAGMPLRQSDRIATSGRGRVSLEFVDGSVLAVGRGTVVELSDYAAPEEGPLDATLTLFLGILRATVSSDAAAIDFDVRTQAAVAAVRSTEWTVEVDEAAHTAVLAIVGTVVVTATAGGEVAIDAGEGTDVAPGSPPSAPALWDERRIRRALGLTDIR